MTDAERIEALEAANEINLQRGSLWRDDCAGFEREVERVSEERDKALSALAESQKREAALREALRFQDPRNATERYDRIADDFYRETRMWPPGRSRPAAMGGDPDGESVARYQAWRAFVNAWHERWFDAALTTSEKGDGK